MKINITKNNYELIIKALSMSSFVYGNLSDFVDNKYKKDSDDLEILESYLLEYANDFHFNKNIDSFDGKLYLNEEYNDAVLDDLFLYDDQQVYENLANKLDLRDFKMKYSQAEIDKMIEEHNGYLGVPLYDFEKRYYDEFEEHNYDRLFIKDK